MYIKIERDDKIELHNAKSYYGNQLKNGYDFNIERIDGVMIRHHFEMGDNVEVFVMNDNGKTIDRI